MKNYKKKERTKTMALSTSLWDKTLSMLKRTKDWMKNYRIYSLEPYQCQHVGMIIYASNKFDSAVKMLIYLQEKNPQKCIYLYDNLQNQIIRYEDVMSGAW